MTYLASPVHLTAEAFELMVERLTWSKGWRPKFPTLHNTGVPNLKTYLGYSADTKARWGTNLDRYYQGLGWHSGPHVVCLPDGILYLCDLEQDGVSVSCWNHLTIGIEMVGDFETEDFATGPGAQVRDNAVAVLAALAKQLGWKLDPLVTGVSGLHFHHMCARDHHACPGSNVSRGDMIARVSAAMGSTPSAAPVQVTAPVGPIHDVAWAQGRLNALGYRPMLTVDGIAGPHTRDATARFQGRSGLYVDGNLNAATLAKLASTPQES